MSGRTLQQNELLVDDNPAGADADVASGCWRQHLKQLAHADDPRLERRIGRALASSPMALQQALLERVGRRVDPQPILRKYLPGPYLRLFFPVRGADDIIERGMVVALVLLYDVEAERTLYAHTVFAGPESNPMLKHLAGPMAQPMAQEGRNGELSTRRFLERKRALWNRFEAERTAIGGESASRRWRDDFYWSLLMLYFCERCAACRWGDPRFDGTAPVPYRPSALRETVERLTPDEEEKRVIDTIIESDIWKLEVAYARRGGFTVLEVPKLVKGYDASTMLLLFPTTVEFVEAGTILGVAVYFDTKSEEVIHTFVLHAGPESEPQFLFGRQALGLPSMASESTETEKREREYVEWRREGWNQFWLDELEFGIYDASANWLDGCWSAVERLLD